MVSKANIPSELAADSTMGASFGPRELLSQEAFSQADRTLSHRTRTDYFNRTNDLVLESPYTPDSARSQEAPNIEPARAISYENGRSAKIIQDDRGEVYQFTSADGVTYKRMDPSREQRADIVARLGHDPGPGFHFWQIDDGSQGKSNGHNDDIVIARVEENNDNISIKNLYPIPQASFHLANGDYIHGYPDGSRTMTRYGEDGSVMTVSYNGGDRAPLMTVSTPDSDHPQVYELDKNGRPVKDLTAIYYGHLGPLEGQVDTSKSPTKQIDYPNGQKAELSVAEDGRVAKFTSGDGVTYTRVKPSAEQEQALRARLGETPPQGYYFYQVENGSQGKSNGNNDKFIIARFGHNEDGAIQVSTLYPVEQSTTYLPNGDFIHAYGDQARSATRTFKDGTTATITHYPDPEIKPNMTINRPKTKE